MSLLRADLIHLLFFTSNRSFYLANVKAPPCVYAEVLTNLGKTLRNSMTTMISLEHRKGEMSCLGKGLAF